MSRRKCMGMALTGILILSTGAARAQNAAPLPPPSMVMVQIPGPEAGMIGERIELLGFEGLHGGKVVTGAPFSAVAVSETIQTLADGNHIAHKTQTNLFRDSQGRFRKEVTLPAIGPLATLGQPNMFVFIHDPVAGASFTLHPDVKVAEKTEAPSGKMKGTMKGNIGYHQQGAIADGSPEKEDLGTQTIAGMSAQGTRITHTIPAGHMGNEKPITIVIEQWYSNDLQMVVMSKRSDPRIGETCYTVTNIQRSEPAASLFVVPSDYTVTAGKNKMFRRFNGGPDAAPPPPPPPLNN
jgi:hypothetical protein